MFVNRSGMLDIAIFKVITIVHPLIKAQIGVCKRTDTELRTFVKNIL